MPCIVYCSWRSSSLKFAQAMEEVTKRSASAVVWDLEERERTGVGVDEGAEDIMVVVARELLIFGVRSRGQAVQAVEGLLTSWRFWLCYKLRDVSILTTVPNQRWIQVHHAK